MDESQIPPLVTVAFPLYRSRRFLEVITENIERLDYPNLEILVGDRHLADDTVEQLRARFAEDSRLRFIIAQDEVGWVAHYNLLLSEGAGEYFVWMPHDDSFPANYVSSLVARLEDVPDAVLAFGFCDSEDEEGVRRENALPAPTWRESAWTSRSALRLLFGCDTAVAMRGVFRRAAPIDAGLWVPAIRSGAHADDCWLFGMALLGRFEFVPEVRCIKRFYGASTQAQWRRPRAFEMPRVLTGYLNRFVAKKAERFSSMGLLWFGAAIFRGIDVLNRVARRTIVSRPATQRAVRWVLGAR